MIDSPCERTTPDIICYDCGATAPVFIADQTGKENAVAKESIEERKVSNLSPMPANFAEQVSEADFRHLMGYLLKQRKD